MIFHSAIYVLQDAVRVPETSPSDGFMDSEFLLLLAVIVIGFIVWRVIKKKRGSRIKERHDTEPLIETSPPAIYIIRASDASLYADKLQLILQNLKMDNRIEDFTILDAGDDLSSLPHNIDEEDLILIVLTNQLEGQKEQIENVVKPSQSRVAEIIVDNVVYDNDFITFPADLRPICDRDDKDTVWDSIEQSLMDMFPARKTTKPEPGQPSGNKRLEAVKNHPEYPELLKVKPGSLRFYGRYGCAAIFGLVFTIAALFMNFIASGFMREFGSSGFGRIILLIFAVLGIGIFVYGIYRLFKLSTASLRRLPALVVDKRTAVSGGGQSSPATTYYYVTLELGDGKRLELESGSNLYGKITKDDAGIAYIRDRYLLAYRRLAV